MKPALLFLLALLAVEAPPARGADVLEIGPGMEKDLPQGREADGIRGDFVLRNDKIVALISQNAPLRRANMSTFYGASGVTPGCLYDLTLRKEQNDQITIFSPGEQRGEVSWVRAVPEADPSQAAVETVVTAAKNGGIYKHHEYKVKDGEQGIWITTTAINESKEKARISLKDEWTKFYDQGLLDTIHWADAVNPADKCGYAYGTPVIAQKGQIDSALTFTELEPGQQITWSRFLAVGRSPMEAWGLVAKRTAGFSCGTVQLHLADEKGKPLTTGRAIWFAERTKLVAYPNESGDISVFLPEGKQQFTFEDMGRSSQTQEIEVKGGETTKSSVTFEPASQLQFIITREDGSHVPCKAQILATGDTKPVDLGPVIRAHGCKDQYHSENGHFTVQVPPGTYHIVVTHGIEYDHHEEDITLAPGQEIPIKATLKRIVDTTGWVSADFHNHSTQSGDNVCGTPDRIINLAAEGIEFAPTTEHNRIFDWRPDIEKLNLLSEIQTVVGMELTGPLEHLNCFPLTVEPFTQDNGAPVWNADPRIAALTLRDWQGERKDRWIQINHPDMQLLFNDRGKNGVADGGFTGIETMVNGMETENGGSVGILSDSPWRLTKAKGALVTNVQYVRQFIWRQLLNLGFRIIPVAVSDAHTVFGNGVGGWRMYLPSKTDEPAKIDWTGDLSLQAKAGHVMLTTGPFLEVTTADGKMPGDEVKAVNGGVELHIKVQCTDWEDIDRVQILVNSRKEPTLNFTRQTHPQMFQDGVVKFDQKIFVPLKTDAHLIVVATDEHMTLKTGYGSSDQAKMNPVAYHAPIYVLVEGDHFKPNGDTLGFDIPVMKMTVDQVRKKLGLQESAEPKKKKQL